MVPIKLLFLLLFALLFSCQNGNGEEESKNYETVKEKIQRSHQNIAYPLSAPKKQVRELYPWELGRVGNLPPITKEFFRCRGCDLNPVKTIEQNGELVTLQDCGGGDHHGLPLRHGQEYVYPILIDLLNYVQVRTEKKVVITSGHRCPAHNSYVDPAHNNLYSKHQFGAEVSFYVEGLENQPETIAMIIQEYYEYESPFKEKPEYREFKRYDKEDTNVSTRPWMNKEIFIKLFRRNEGRNYDNRHPYPYLSVQVRYDAQVKENVIYTWKRAHMEFLRK